MITAILSRRIIALFILVELCGSIGRSASLPAPPPGTVVVLDPRAEATWTKLLTDLRQLQAQASTPKDNGVASGKKMPAVALADRFLQFRIDYPGAPQGIEASKLEALLLIDAVSDGADAESKRMEAMVQSLRTDLAFPASTRAEVAATYEFRKAHGRVTTPSDVPQVYEEVARALMVEFPDQPQGAGSLVTLADDQDAKQAKAVADEVEKSRAPEEVKERARAMSKRKALLGRQVGELLGDYMAAAESSWVSGNPTIVYFWAAWSADSLSLATTLRDMDLTGCNVLGVCLDENVTSARSAASAARLPGRLVYLTDGLKSSLARNLGVVDLPSVFLANKAGAYTDVKAINDLPAKIQALRN